MHSLWKRVSAILRQPKELYFASSHDLVVNFAKLGPQYSLSEMMSQESIEDDNYYYAYSSREQAIELGVLKLMMRISGGVDIQSHGQTITLALKAPYKAYIAEVMSERIGVFTIDTDWFAGWEEHKLTSSGLVYRTKKRLTRGVRYLETYHVSKWLVNRSVEFV